MSKNPDNIAIVVGEDEGTVIFKWDLITNTEMVMKDLTGPFKILQDADGEMYIVNKSSIFSSYHKFFSRSIGGIPFMLNPSISILNTDKII